MSTRIHHRRRRRHHRPVAGADAGAPRPSRAADRAVGRAVRARRQRAMRARCSAPYCETEAAAPVDPRPGPAIAWRCGARLFRAPSLDGTLVVAAARDKRRGRPLRAPDRRPRHARCGGHRQAGARPGRPLRRRPVLSPAKAHVPTVRGDALPARGDRARRRRGRASAPSWPANAVSRRDRHRLPRPRRRAASLPTCAACAASASCCARARSTCTGRCGSCIRATRSTSCRGATACFMIGATVIESDDAGPVTVRSALELLGSAYALHPAFAEAEIVEMGAGVRPAFADNVPKIVRARPHHPRQRPLPPRLPAGARAVGAGRRLPRDRRHRQPRVRDRTKAEHRG